MKKEPGLFTKKVWEIAENIPPGKVITYGLIARAAGAGGQAARSISGILAKHPNQNKIPWHRIIYSDGRAWLTPKCKKERLALYKKEGIDIDKNNRIVGFRNILYIK